MSVDCGDGIINLRVGAIIIKNGKFLMVGNDNSDYLYSVGGRIKMGETSEQAVVREVFEETGVRMEIDRLGYVHENYFYSDSPAKSGKTVYEISFFYFMKTPEDFSPASGSFTEEGNVERLVWVDIGSDAKYYPEFFREELKNPSCEIKHFTTNDL